jgi:RNA polymerase sigma-70 factor (ECF subfamily)
MTAGTPDEEMIAEPLLLSAEASGEPEEERRAPEEEAPGRVRQLVDRYFDAVWRFVRRLGLPPDAADDVAQETFLVAARKVDTIRTATERQYLFAIAVRVAMDARRTRSRRRELPEADASPHVDPLPRPDELLDRKRARQLLQDILDSMPIDLRAAFTLFEIEGMPLPEVAEILGIPLGTATSRLRRARELFQTRARRLTAAPARTPGGRHA